VTLCILVECTNVSEDSHAMPYQKINSWSLPVDTQTLLGTGDLYGLLVTHTAVT